MQITKLCTFTLGIGNAKYSREHFEITLMF